MKRAIQILRDLNSPDKVVKRNRTNFIRLMDILGHPHQHFKSIHITGTNGKGSVALKTASILSKSGLKAGLYTSPHLFTLRERIQVNGECVEKQPFAEYIIKLDEISKRENIPLSYFEFLTASAFLHFQAEKCQYVSLEVGVGGRGDTTTIVTPEVSVITSLGLDHTDLLGSTVQEIGWEKAGIIKEGRPVILGATAQVQTVIDYAKQMKAPIYTLRSHEDFQEQNNELSRKVIEVLQQRNPRLKKITQKNMKEGLCAKQPCRMEKLCWREKPKWASEKELYFDVGHNPAAMQKVGHFFKNQKYKQEQISVVYGASKGKNYSQILEIIEKFAGYIYLIQADHFRSAPISDLQSHIGFSKHPYKYRLIANGNIEKTLQGVTADPLCSCVLICGSFFIMPQARGFYQPSLRHLSQENLNEVYQIVKEKQSN